MCWGEMQETSFCAAKHAVISERGYEFEYGRHFMEAPDHFLNLNNNPLSGFVFVPDLCWSQP